MSPPHRPLIPCHSGSSRLTQRSSKTWLKQSSSRRQSTWAQVECRSATRPPKQEWNTTARHQYGRTHQKCMTSPQNLVSLHPAHWLKAGQDTSSQRTRLKSPSKQRGTATTDKPKPLQMQLNLKQTPDRRPQARASPTESQAWFP